MFAQAHYGRFCRRDQGSHRTGSRGIAARGISDEEAGRKARLKFGSVRREWSGFICKAAGWGWTTVMRDLQLCLRSLTGEPRIHAHGNCDTGAGHGREHGSVQRDECGVDAVAAGSRCGSRRVSANHRIRRTGQAQWKPRDVFLRQCIEALRKQSGAMSAVMAYVPLSASKVAVRMARSRRKRKETWSAVISSPAWA